MYQLENTIIYLYCFLVTPILPVIIGLAAGHSGYSVRSEEGDIL